MKRRNFLKLSGLVLATGALTSLKTVSAFSKIIKNETSDFSLEAIVKDSDKAVILLEEFAKSGKLYNGLIKYSEYPIAGEVMGDLVYVKDNRLVDYTSAYDDTSMQLQEIRRKLGLPSKIENPVRLRLYRNSGEPAKKLYVSQKGKIINSINPGIDNSYTFYGNSGKIILKTNDGVSFISDSECKHKICKKMGSIKKAGDYLTCIPNELHIFAE